jgi:hypothetical protein
VSAPTDPLDAALAVARAFDLGNVPYAIGGALAYGVWGIPRATLDIDVNVFVEDIDLQLVVDALAPLGVVVDLQQAQRDSTAEGMFVARFGPYRLDLFTPSIPFSREAERSRVPVTIEGQVVQFLSAEALAVFKMLFFRPKDIVDLERLLHVQGDKLESTYVRSQLVDMMGDRDARVTKWDELVTAWRAALGG